MLWKNNKHICIDLKLGKLESNNSVSVMYCTSSLNITEKQQRLLRAGIPDMSPEEILNIRSSVLILKLDSACDIVSKS